jgi:cell division transport system permease protein
MKALLHRLLRQHPLASLGAALAIAGALALIGALALLSQGALAAQHSAADALGAWVLLRPDTPDDRALAFSDELAAWPEVAQARLISPQEHLDALRARQVDVRGLDAALLPFAVSISLRDPVAAFPAAHPRLLALRDRPEVDQVELGDLAVAELAASLTPLRWWSLGAAALVALVSVLVVTNAVGLAIFRRREEIELLRLLGARDRHVLWPFFAEALTLGLTGGALAAAALLASLQAVAPAASRALGGLPILLPQLALWLVPAALLGGALLALLGAALSARHYLRRVEAPWSDPGRPL